MVKHISILNYIKLQKKHINEPTRENTRKYNKRNKLFVRENLDTSKIINTERQRKIRPEFQKLLSR